MTSARNPHPERPHRLDVAALAEHLAVGEHQIRLRLASQ